MSSWFKWGSFIYSLKRDFHVIDIKRDFKFGVAFLILKFVIFGRYQNKLKFDYFIFNVKFVFGFISISSSNFGFV